MENTVDLIKSLVGTWAKEDEKFCKGNASAGTRARKALSELGKLVKVRRSEITEEKNRRKAEKEQAK